MTPSSETKLEVRYPWDSSSSEENSPKEPEGEQNKPAEEEEEMALAKIEKPPVLAVEPPAALEVAEEFEDKAKKPESPDALAKKEAIAALVGAESDSAAEVSEPIAAEGSRAETVGSPAEIESAAGDADVKVVTEASEMVKKGLEDYRAGQSPESKAEAVTQTVKELLEIGKKEA
jgi:hypothetical protein